VPAEPILPSEKILPLTTFRWGLDLGDYEFVGIFTECKLPDVEWDLQQLKEGGQNTYVHQLLGQRKQSQVTLKYGLIKGAWMLDWYAKVMAEDFRQVAKTVTVKLIDSEGHDVLLWHLHGAYPVKITWPELKTSDNAVAVLSLTLACARVEFDANP
jgi:phage tail-like protein